MHCASYGSSRPHAGNGITVRFPEQQPSFLSVVQGGDGCWLVRVMASARIQILGKFLLSSLYVFGNAHVDLGGRR